MNKVFQPAKIASIKLNNRIIRSATHEGMGEDAGDPMEGLASFYERLARGGVGAIITGFSSVDKAGKAMTNQRLFDDDRHIAAYKNITASVNKSGAPIIAQVAHAGGQTNRKVTGSDVVAPSAALYRLMMSNARELTEQEIRGIINDFAAAIVRAKKAGFNGVQLHAAHGYLLSEFLSPFTNRRTDRWGGSTENRFRIVAEILDAARKKVGAYPILAKISAFDFDKGGMTVDESVRVAELCQKQGLDALEVSCGGVTDGMNSMRVTSIPIDAILTLVPWMAAMPASKKIMLRLLKRFIIKTHKPLLNHNVDAAARIKGSVDIPVIVVGGIRKLSDIEAIIGEGRADFVSMARPFIIEPDLVKKFKSGAQNESKCINCGYCLYGAVGGKLRCFKGKLPSAARS
jgi:2,4-dienoyl-CoA reductase-like NADH-dependent reductase (Old Yellow Enzyme family)